ncbi:serine--tRNA ligase [candidate division TA06 bacterium]|uniref:Serine--tRNA ligase n=1 Tax=candidate division TA06 bacterium TaxID=2250710 RepID=A0A523XLJ8_UNCT6|nr:MAG: serine--tRNA ligase [candidate division TA06 bacterium]
MHDMKALRGSPEVFKKAIEDRAEKIDVDGLLKMDASWRSLVSRIDELKHEKNVASERIAGLKKKGKDASTEIKRMKEVSQRIKKMEEEARVLEGDIREIMVVIPNGPHKSVPVGRDSAANVVVKEWGEKKPLCENPLPHWEVGEILGILDFPRAAKISGAHFASYCGAGATLERALVNFMLDLHVNEHGYKEMFPPYLVNRDSMFSTAQLRYEEDMYRCEVDDLFLDPTAETPLINLHRDEILKTEDLPIRYVGYTACFRREAGSYGKEPRGLLRVHQFNKVELISIMEPEKSYEELEIILNHAEKVLQLLEIPYRVCSLSTGEISFASAKTYDIEAWAPGVGKWLEVSSVSNCTDFQARRAQIKFRREKGAPSEYVHTLNGSGLATPRTFAAIIENYQEKDGTVVVPEVLRPYMNGLEKIR